MKIINQKHVVSIAELSLILVLKSFFYNNLTGYEVPVRSCIQSVNLISYPTGAS